MNDASFASNSAAPPATEPTISPLPSVSRCRPNIPLAPLITAMSCASLSAMTSPPASYFDTSTWDSRDVLSGGARKIPVSTPSGEFHVWTKRVGNNPDLKVLLLHGGPGSTHEYLEAVDSYLPAAGVEYYFYDQLGSGFSD